MNLEVKTYSDYRLLLKSFLENKKNADKSFSLRAWARQVGVPPSTLSEFLNGHRELNLERLSAISHSLELSEEERVQFLILVISNQVQDQALLDFLRGISRNRN
jgi:uncharacterized protein (TIGR02147 family)